MASLNKLLAGRQFISGSSRVSLGSDLSHVGAFLTQEVTPATYKQIKYLQSPKTHKKPRDEQSLETGVDS